MLALSIVIVSLTVSVASVFYALRTKRDIEREFEELRLGIDNHTVGESSSSSGRSSSELEDCLKEVFQENEHSLMVLAINELSGQAALARMRAVALAKGMVRIPFLSGATGAIAAVAFGSFQEQAMSQALVALGAGFLCSLLAQSVAKKAMRVAGSYAKVTESLASQVERHWRTELCHGGRA